MNINVKTKNYELTPDVRAYLDERLEALEKLITDGAPVICDIELEQTMPQQHGNIWRAEINLSHNGTILYADATAESMNAAIDGMKAEIIKQLRRSKGKEETLMRKGQALAKRWLRWGR